MELIYLSGRFGPGNGLPSSFTYENFGKVRQKGLELGVDSDITGGFTGFVNYSYQPTPEPSGFDISELNLPSKHRFNIGTNYSGGRWLGNLSVSYASDAYWQDVLDSRYHGYTDAFTLVNGTLGYRLTDNFTTTLKVINLFDQEIQQHIFGDIMRRQVVLELRMRVGAKP